MDSSRSNGRPTLKEPRGQRILITGGTGFIGSAIARRLCENNELILMDHRWHGSAYQLSGYNGHRNVRVLTADILDEAAVAIAVEDVTMVVHLAALVGVNTVRARPRQTIRTNLLGTVNVLAALEGKQNLQKFLYFSTSEVFGINSFRVDEAALASVGPVQEARWSYSISKLAGEHLVQSYHQELDLPTVTIRPFNIFGPGRIGDHAMLRFIMAALRDREIEVHGSGDQIRSWCYVDDLVNAVVAALVNPEADGEDFNIGNPRNTLTIYELARRVVTLTGSRSKIRFVKAGFSDIDIRVPRLDKSRQLLAFEPRVELDEGVRHTADWCEAHYNDVAAALEDAAPAVPEDVLVAGRQLA